MFFLVYVLLLMIINVFSLGDAVKHEEKEKPHLTSAKKAANDDKVDKTVEHSRNAVDVADNTTDRKRHHESTPKTGTGRATGRKSVVKEENEKLENTVDTEKSAPPPPPPPVVECVLERRAARAMAEDSMKYSIDSVTRCPFPGCDSKGISTLKYLAGI